MAAGWLALGAAGCAEKAGPADNIPTGDDPTFAMPERVLIEGNLDQRTEERPVALLELAKGFEAEASARFGRSVMVTAHPTTRAVKSINVAVGFLTEPREGTPMDIAKDFALANADVLGLETHDLDGMIVTDEVYARNTGITHIWFGQTYKGVPVFDANLHINVDSKGRITSVSSGFVPNLREAVTTVDPSLAPTTAIRAFASHIGVELTQSPTVLQRFTGFAPGGVVAEIAAPELSTEPMRPQVRLVATGEGDVEVGYNFQVQTLDGQHWYDTVVGAGEKHAGKALIRHDWTHSAGFKVYPYPMENPDDSNPPQPADGRVFVQDPEDEVASPNGWMLAGSNETRGNNTNTYLDRDRNNSRDPSTPNCSGSGNSAVCDFPVDFSRSPLTYQGAAVTNAFYWTNLIHDVAYQYGWDEVAGAFQDDNFGRGGRGGDAVQAEVQDGSGTNNANFSTPPDGQDGRMQMYLWDGRGGQQDRDGDFSAVIMAHEIGHGYSIRLTGGPSNSGCLNSAEQFGEGFADSIGYWFTLREGDKGSDARGIGTYARYQPLTGAGIRPWRYSTNYAQSYESIQGQAIPHGVGSVWGQAFWQVMWALIDKYGFDPDIYNATGGAGNQRALLYLTEGLKQMSCPANFLSNRDGIIAAAQSLNDGEDVCLIWDAFAKFGLGADAQSLTSGRSPRAQNGFELPGECNCAVAEPRFQTPIVDTLSVTVPFTIPGECDGVEADGGSLDWTVRGGTDSGSVALTVDGQTLVGDLPNFPPNTVIEYTVTARGARGTSTTFPKNEADPEYELYFGETEDLFFDDFEAGAANWTLSGFQVGATSASPGGDPAEAYSGSAVLGDSLGADYTPSVQASASVAVTGIDARRYESVRLQFRRVLNVEDSIFDQATITVDGQEVFQNVSRDLPGDNNPDNNFHHLDREWRFIDIDITEFAQDGEVTLNFTLASDAGLQYGGWNLDDVAIVGFGGAFCGDGNTNEGEECDDGNNEDGDGCSSTCTTEGGGDGDGDGDGDTDGDGTGDTDGDGTGDTDGDGTGDTDTTGTGTTGTGTGGTTGGDREDEGGCSVAPAQAPSTSLLAGLFLALAFITRRPRRKR